MPGHVNCPGESLTLSANQGGYTTFYDSIYISDMDSPVVLNGKGSGSIIFSGMFVREDLEKKQGASPTDEQVTASFTSEILSAAELLAGTLAVKDGAIVQVNGLTVGSDTTSAQVRLENGTLGKTGYGIDFKTGSSLSLEGVNTIVVDTLTATDSTWSFTLSALNASDALLTFSGNLDASNLTINLLGAESDALSGIRSLKLLTGATESQWAGVTWTGTGIEADKLRWDGTTLWYDLMAPGEYADIIVTAPQSLTSAELTDPVNVIVRGGGGGRPPLHLSSERRMQVLIWRIRPLAT